jgi:hypothetical protein
MRNRIPITVFFCVFISLPAYADNAAPFGLTWGTTKSEILKLGVKLKEIKADNAGKRFSAKGLPKMITDVHSVFLSLGFNDKLHRVAAVSKDFENDPYGRELKSRYNKLAKLLTAKYGNGAKNHHTDTELYTEPSSFLMGIKNGRSWHYTDYSNEKVSIQLGIRASSSSVGYYLLIYQNKALEKGVKEQLKKKEKEAL